MTRKIINKTMLARSALKLTVNCTIAHALLLTSVAAAANDRQGQSGVIDEQRPSAAWLDNKELIKQVKQEQRELSKLNRQQLKIKADKGERLAQVALGADFASEAQMLTFAPVAANDALSDAVRWYNLAAKRGFPGAPSLDSSGVSFYPVRVVRNK